MDGGDRAYSSLFFPDDRDIRGFLFTLAASITIHLGVVVALIFASEYTSPPPLSASVMDVSIVSLPESAPAPGPGPAEVATPAARPDVATSEPEPMTQAELEALLMEQQSVPEPAPEPEPEPVPETPAPEPPAPAGEQVVIDPEEPKSPPPEKPAEPKQPPEKTPPEKPTPVPVKAPRFAKPVQPPKAVEAPEPDKDSVRQAIAEIQKKIARRTEGRYRVAPEPAPEPAPPRRSGGGSSNGAGGRGSLGLQARAAITSYAGSVLPDRINRNWAFSEHLASRRFNLEAVLVIKIRADGEITDIWFEKKSGDRYFDTSAYNAVVKSNPLPPLPQAYTAYADVYTIGLRFTPSGLN